ncbi:MAG: MGMT family protein [Pseudomonadota bacterium]|nr:MGMT family protein [Pseudomonadota bacterium]
MRDIARPIGNPAAWRAVGAAVGKNPCFLGPLRQVIGRSGCRPATVEGLARKQASLGVNEA